MRDTWMTRRRFLALLGAGAATVATGYAFPSLFHAVYGKANDATYPLRKAARALTGDTSLDAIAARQIITADSRTTRTIQWQTREAYDDAAVEWRVAPDRATGGTSDNASNNATAVVSAHAAPYTDDGQHLTLYTAHLTDLPAGARLAYRLVCGAHGTAWRPLATDAGGDFTALLFPDTQCSDGYITWRDVAQAAARCHPDAAFFVNMGDLVDNGEDHNQWRQWFAGAEDLIGRIPLVPVMGNHETYTLDWKLRLPAAYLQLFAVPENGIPAWSRYFFSYDYGDVHFTVLNTQANELDELQPGLMDAELPWLHRDLAQTKKRWKVVLMHRDVLRYGIRRRPDRVPGIDDLGRTLMPIFDAYGVDAVLTAHLHTYRNRGRLYDFKHSDRGPLYLLTGVAGNVRYPDFWIDHDLDRVKAPQPETANYLTMTATHDALRFTCYLPDGTIIDKAQVTKG